MSKLFQTAALFGVLITQAACGGGSTPQETPPPTTQIPPPTTPLTQLSTDTFTNPSSQHATEVEASAFGSGSTIVSAFQVGRIFSGGGSDIGFATTTNAGATWTHGSLPGITVYANGTYDAASDAVVAFDAAHGVWMVSSLAIGNVDQIIVNRSADGLQWDNPVIVSTTPDSDKNWVVCDNTATSPYYGNCYVEWDDPSRQNVIWMSTSSDGGLTWGTARATADLATGIGGQPLVQPSGKVIVPMQSVTGAGMLSFSSADGGATWNEPTTISSITDHLVTADLRASPLPTAAVDAAGTVYVIWQDCRFRTGCTANDLVMSTSADGDTWTAPVRVPIDPLASTVDHFIPGLAVEPGTAGSTAHLGLTYYSYAAANCDATNCSLYTAFISSPDGGSSWTAPITLAGPMSPAWLPNTFAGVMVGDYMATAFAGGKAFPIFAAASMNIGTLFDEVMFTTSTGLTNRRNATSYVSPAGESPVPNAHSDHPPREFYDQEHRRRMNPPED